jgi:hypothetical protein
VILYQLQNLFILETDERIIMFGELKGFGRKLSPHISRLGVCESILVILSELILIITSQRA